MNLSVCDVFHSPSSHQHVLVATVVIFGVVLLPLHKRWGVCLGPVPAALIQGKLTLVPLDKELGGPWSQCGPFGKKENILPLSGMKLLFLGGPAYNLVTIVVSIHIIFLEPGHLKKPLKRSASVLHI